MLCVSQIIVSNYLILQIPSTCTSGVSRQKYVESTSVIGN